MRQKTIHTKFLGLLTAILLFFQPLFYPSLVFAQTGTFDAYFIDWPSGDLVPPVEIPKGEESVVSPKRMGIDNNNKIWFTLRRKNTSGQLISSLGELNTTTGQMTEHELEPLLADPASLCPSPMWVPETLAVDKNNGVVWFGPYGSFGKIGKYNPSTNTLKCYDLPPKYGSLNDLTVAQNGHVWMMAIDFWRGKDYSHIYEFDPLTEQFSLPYITPFFGADTIVVDENNIVWINDGYRSLWKLDPSKPAIPFDRNPFDVCKPSGTQYVSGYQFTCYNIAPDRIGHGLLKDTDGSREILWYGYSDKEVGKFYPENGENYHEEVPTGAESYPRAFNKDSQGNIFFLGKARRVYRLNPSTWDYIDFEAVVGWGATDMVIDSGENLWFSQGNSLVKFPSSLRTASLSQVIPVRYKKTMAKASGGKLVSDFNDTISIPTNALMTDPTVVSMTMEKSPGPRNQNEQPIPRAFVYGPSGEDFTPQKAGAKVSYYNGVDLQTIDPANIVVNYWDSDSLSWKVQSSANDTTNHILTFDTPHFSKYALFAPKISFSWAGPLAGGENIYPLVNGQMLPINFRLDREDGGPIAQETLMVQVSRRCSDHPEPDCPTGRKIIQQFRMPALTPTPSPTLSPVPLGLLSYDEGIYKAQFDTASFPPPSFGDPTFWDYKAEVFYAGLKKNEAKFAILSAQTEALVYAVALVSPQANEKGWHNKDVTVTIQGYFLSVNSGGGVEKIYYTLDGVSQENLGPQTIISLSSEGIHNLTYWAVGRGTNSQGEKVIIESPKKNLEIKIDKTPPEAILSFETNYQAVKVEGVDEHEVEIIPTVLAQTKNEKKYDQENQGKTTTRSSRQSISYTIYDEAGNSLELPVNITTTQSELKASIENLVYNGTERNPGDNTFHFKWVLGDTNQYSQLHQEIRSQDFGDLVSTYDLKDGETTVRVLTQGEKTEKNLISGMAILQVRTNQGRLEYSP